MHAFLETSRSFSSLDSQSTDIKTKQVLMNALETNQALKNKLYY
jgi:hypothetical protein